VLTALAQNNCGPQYAAAARGPGNFIDSLFGNNQTLPPPSADLGAPSGTFRTVCVRTCDGGYFPVSFATYQARFQDDERTCKALCPATEGDAVHLPQSRRGHQSGGLDRRPALLVAAQRVQIPHRVQPLLRLQGRGQTWSEALKSVDDRAGVEQGDIIVTEESAKRMQQRAQPKGRRRRPRKAQRLPAPPPRRLQQPPRPIRRLPPPTRTRSARWARPSSRRSSRAA
jgi:hypothetical protein